MVQKLLFSYSQCYYFLYDDVFSRFFFRRENLSFSIMSYLDEAYTIRNIIGFACFILNGFMFQMENYAPSVEDGCCICFKFEFLEGKTKIDYNQFGVSCLHITPSVYSPLKCKTWHANTHTNTQCVSWKYEGVYVSERKIKWNERHFIGQLGNKNS